MTQNITTLRELKQHFRDEVDTLGYSRLYFTSEGTTFCSDCFTNKKKRRLILEHFESGIMFDLEDHYDQGFCNCELCNQVLGGIE